MGEGKFLIKYSSFILKNSSFTAIRNFTNLFYFDNTLSGTITSNYFNNISGTNIFGGLLINSLSILNSTFSNLNEFDYFLSKSTQIQILTLYDY